MANTSARRYEVEDAWEFYELALRNRWTDGLPVLPPTPEVVEPMLEYVGGDPQASLGTVPPKHGVATVEKIAINAAMAGCRPEYLPVVMAALEAMLDPLFNLGGVQTTTNACAPLAIVSGPLTRTLGFNYRDGVFGGGSQANATIGRALRLILWNIGRGLPGDTDMASLGHPGKYTFCIAENPDLNPWASFSEMRGFGPDTDTVTVFACDPPHSLFVPGDALRILNVIAQTLPTYGVNMFHDAGQYLVVIGPRAAQELNRAGFGVEDIRTFLFENARYTLGDIRRDGVQLETEHTGAYWGGVETARWNVLQRDDQKLPMVETRNDIHLVVTGGMGQWWCGFCPGWGKYGGYAITRPIRMASRS